MTFDDPALPDADARTRFLAGDAALERLACSSVMVLGLGGVGGSCVEALARGGVGSLVLIDPDVVVPSNLNRQAVARVSTMGMAKTQAAAALVRDVRPACAVHTVPRKILSADVGPLLDEYRPSYVVDAQDTVATKVALALACEERDIPLISSMGTGNKLRPELFRIDDIANTSVCPLCRVVRKLARARGVKAFTVLYSTEPPLEPQGLAQGASEDMPKVGTVSFVPPVAGMMLAGHVLRALGGF